jgi:hypothetical protein
MQALKYVATLAAGLAVFAMACGANRGDPVLHLSGVDMTENEFRQVLDMHLGVPDPLGAQLVSGLCSVKSTEELIQWSGNGPLGGENDDGYGAYPRGGAQWTGPGMERPGQRAEPRSKERAYEIVQGWCRAL